MALRRPLTTTLADPPAGTIRIAFWRHLSESSGDPELLDLHRGRALIVHELVDSAKLDVRDWGGVDADHPAEVVEIVVSAFASPIAARVVDFLFKRIKRRRKREEKVLMAVTMRRPDGAELVWEFDQGVSAEVAAAEITKFLNGQAVSRVLGMEP